eukprot:TRINITY_DN1411_c0_g1_i1.p1 TRINITY_DN1411_c0_g1~~TRINITY_DN1411_c0_g1_i1.p1  ORF type:complete len:250 (+),score=-32.53 TRINITY_DN1411_c0_g1_i1:1048-1797(+)
MQLLKIYTHMKKPLKLQHIYSELLIQTIHTHQDSTPLIDRFIICNLFICIFNIQYKYYICCKIGGFKFCQNSKGILVILYQSFNVKPLPTHEESKYQPKVSEFSQLLRQFMFYRYHCNPRHVLRMYVNYQHIHTKYACKILILDSQALFLVKYLGHVAQSELFIEDIKIYKICAFLNPQKSNKKKRNQSCQFTMQFINMYKIQNYTIVKAQSLNIHLHQKYIYKKMEILQNKWLYEQTLKSIYLSNIQI